MLKRVRAIVAGALLCLAPTLAVRGQDRAPYDLAEAEQAMSRFAACVVDSRSRRPRAEHYLRILPAEASLRAGRALADDSEACVPHDASGTTEMRLRPDLLRAALYSALYQRDFSGTAPADLTSISPLVVSQEFDGSQAIPDDLFFMRTLGDCTARANPAGVHALLLTQVASSEERPALDAVMHALGGCLSQGRELHFSRSMLRGMLAEALYKLRKAAQGGVVNQSGGR
jgi:hypothetical protein